MSDSVGTKINRKMFQIKSHLHVSDKTLDFDLKTAKAKVSENKKLYKKILHRAEILPEETYNSINTLKYISELVGDESVSRVLNSVEQIGFESIQSNLIIPLQEHIDYYSKLERKITDCHNTRVDMDRHKNKLDKLVKHKAKENRIDLLQKKYETEKEKYDKLKLEIIKETNNLENDRIEITHPIMTSLLYSYTNHLDSIYSQWNQIRQILNEQPVRFEEVYRGEITGNDAVKYINSSSNSIPQEVITNRQFAECIYPYEGDKDEISIKTGDIIKIIKNDGERIYGEHNGQRGYIPNNFVRII